MWVHEDKQQLNNNNNHVDKMQNLRKPVGSELSILSGNKMSSHIEAIGTCSLTLSSGFVLVLERTFYLPSFSQNLIYVSRFVPLGFSFTFQDNVFNLFHKSNHIGIESFVDGLSCPDSRSDPIGGSKQVSGRETIYWDSLPVFFFI